MASDFEVVVQGCIASITLVSQVQEEREYFTGIVGQVLKFLQVWC